MTTTPATDLHLLRDAIDGLHTAMLTSIDAGGALNSKPMHLLSQDEKGHFWFFAQVAPGDAGAARQYLNVNLAFSQPSSTRYVSVACHGEVVRDRERIHALWSVMAKPWFPDGPDAPDLACLKMTPLHAELWDGPGNGLSQALAIAASVVAGRPVGMGDHMVLDDFRPHAQPASAT